MTMWSHFPLEQIGNLHTPCYFYQVDLLRSTLGELLRASQRFSSARLHYAVKANHHPRLLGEIARSGLGADCVSQGEIRQALDAGIDPHHIVFAGVGKTDEEIRFAIERDIACLHAESWPELQAIDAIARTKGRVARVALRINPDIDAHTHANIATGHAGSKFGIDHEQLPQILLSMPALRNVHLTGLHIHIGSQISDMSDFVELCRIMNRMQQLLKAYGVTVGHVNVGGGLAVDYAHPDAHPIPDFDAYFSTLHKHLHVYEGQTVHFEPGRSVVAQCGSVLSRVTYVKEGRNRTFVVLDAGMNDLLRPALYRAEHRIKPLQPGRGPLQAYDVVGPVCESSDVFGREVLLPPVRRGDLLRICSAGAYGQSMASTYNSRALPQAYFSDQ